MKMKLSNVWQKIFLFLSPSLFVWAVWQHEVLFIYQKIGIPTGQVLDWSAWWNAPATLFTGLTSTHGVVYDLTLLAGFSAFAMWSLAIFFWNRHQLNEAKKRIEELEKDNYDLVDNGIRKLLNDSENRKV